jgi:iron complex transport system substrate-binding protein
MAGRNVTVPWTINRVAITTQGGAIQDVVLFAGADKIVGLSSSKGLDNLQKMCPDVNLAQTVYSSSINAETIIALNPDIVITSKSSTNKTTYQQIEAAGIPVVGIGCGSNNNIELIEKEFRMFGALFNCPEKAEALISFWDTQLAMIQQHEQSITSENKVRAYYVLGSITHTNGKSAWGQALMDSAGVINVAYDLTVSDTDVEQLIKWNPDLMFLSSNEGKFVSISEVMTSPQLQDISAVKNTRVYLSPVGTFWWDRPSPEAILGITWLAKTAYPAQFADVDLFSISSNFYQTFYNYTLTPSDYQGFLAPTS